MEEKAEALQAAAAALATRQTPTAPRQASIVYTLAANAWGDIADSKILASEAVVYYRRQLECLTLAQELRS